MKKLYLKGVVAMSLSLFTASLTQAQLVGGDAYLQGTYVEAGLNQCGAYASSVSPPAGYEVTGLTGLNFIADSDMDGWGAGTPEYCGDYAIPGSPVEGWGIQIAGTSYHNTDRTCATFNISGSISSYTAEGDSVEALWEGSVAGVDISQRSVLHADDLYVLTWITLTNTTAEPISDIYYKRNIDPDNEQIWSGSYVTINSVTSSPFSGDLDAVVTAEGALYGCYLALAARNPQARPSYGGFSTVGGAVSDAYNGITPYNLSGSVTVDGAVQMSFYIPALGAGESTTFAMAHVFSADALEEALDATYVGGYVDCAGTPEVGGAFATAESTCASDVFTLSVDVAAAVGITYQWQSSADGITYADIAGATGPSYSTTQTDATYYQCMVSCTASGEATTSDAVFVDNVCPGCTDEAALNYNPEANSDDGSCFYGYTILDCDYGSSLISVPEDATELCLSDDEVSAAISMGFTFDFYGTPYTNAYIGSNGYMNFSGTTLSACCAGQLLPNGAYPASIFFGQNDWNPAFCGAGTISYWTQGTPGSQIFVVDFNAVPHYGVDLTNTVQVQLFEGSGDIKIVTTEITNDGSNATMGLNLDGTIAQPVEGRNSTIWTAAEECILFTMAEPVTCPGAPTPTVEVISSTYASISWDAVDGVDKYVFAIRDNTTGERWNTQTTATNMELTALTAGHSYTVRLRTVCYPDGFGSPGMAVDFTMPLRIGQLEEGISIYPNPSDGNIRIQLTGFEAGDVDVVVSNTLGQVVYSTKLSVGDDVSVHDLNLSDLGAGTYTIRLMDGTHSSTQNIVIE